MVELILAAAITSVPIPPPPKEATNVVVKSIHYFAVTAKHGGLESDYSIELAGTNLGNRVTLAWDPPPDAPTNITYNLYWGTNSRGYNKVVTNLTALTNTIFLKDTVYELSILSSSNATGSFIRDTNFPRLKMTNVIGSKVWKMEIRQVP